MSAEKIDVKSINRRRVPRRPFQRLVGVLHKGHYYIGKCNEIGEGGLLLELDQTFNEGDLLLINFRAPNDTFVSIKSIIRHVNKNKIHFGLEFVNIDFATQRSIRTFVASKNA